jgi:AraC-like DNA-binding protein
MGLKIHLNDIQGIVYETGTSGYKVDSVGTQETDFSYEYRNIKGRFKEVTMPNFKINYGENSLLDKTTVLFEFDEESVEMQFTLQGKSTTTINKMPSAYTLNANTHNIFYCNDIKGKLELYTKEANIFEINLRPSFFEQYLPNDAIFKKFKKIIQNKEIGFLNKNNYPISPQMHSIIQEIIHCSWVNEYRQLFLDSKVLELLLLQMHQISTFSINTVYRKTSKAIISKMHDVKDIIIAQLNAPLSLSDLAKEVNTNKGTLKKEFKNTFGVSVFGYLRDLKMKEAKSMLLNQELSVGEISDKVGYKNPQHFSTAFKKKFGISPSELLKG